MFIASIISPVSVIRSASSNGTQRTFPRSNRDTRGRVAGRARKVDVRTLVADRVRNVFLNDALDGPLPIALYSAALFSVTEGRADSAAEYHGWLAEAGLVPSEIVSTAIHYGVLTGHWLT